MITKTGDRVGYSAYITCNEGVIFAVDESKTTLGAPIDSYTNYFRCYGDFDYGNSEYIALSCGVNKISFQGSDIIWQKLWGETLRESLQKGVILREAVKEYANKISKATSCTVETIIYVCQEHNLYRISSNGELTKCKLFSIFQWQPGDGGERLNVTYNTNYEFGLLGIASREQGTIEIQRKFYYSFISAKKALMDRILTDLNDAKAISTGAAYPNIRLYYVRKDGIVFSDLISLDR